MSQNTFTQFRENFKKDSPLFDFFMKSKDTKYRAQIIDRAIGLFDEGKFLEVWDLISQENFDHKVGLGHEPIISMIFARASQEICRRNLSPYPSLIGDYRGGMDSYLSAATAALEIQTDLIEKYEDITDPKVQNLYMTYHTIQQYGTFHGIQYLQLIKYSGIDTAKSWWAEGEFDQHNDYTGVDPLIMWLCPPHHIWKKYVYNGFVYEAVDGATELKKTPVGEYDFSKDVATKMPWE